MWLILSIVSIVFYAVGELFQKISSSFEEDNSELRLLVWFGIICGITSVLISALGLKESDVTVFSMIENNPISILSPLLYFMSLFICFLAFKFIPLSIAAPIISADGILTFIGVVILYMFIGKEALVDETITPLKLILVALSFVGIYACGIIQSKLENKDENKILKSGSVLKKGCFALIGILLALMSASFDACSSLTDIYLLTEEFEFFDYLYVHGTMVFAFTIIIYLILWVKEKKPYNPFSKAQAPKLIGAGCDSFGMFFYMAALSKNAIYTNVIISASCVLAVIFSRVFLKEKTVKSQQLWIVFTIVCIIAFAVVDEIF